MSYIGKYFTFTGAPASTFTTDDANVVTPTALGNVFINGGINIGTTGAIANTVTINLDTALTGLTSITMANAGQYRTTTTLGETVTIDAYDTGGAAYTPFITLTAGNPPTCDLATGVTIAGAYIYRAGGTDVAVTDGGTGLSAVATGELLYGSAANTYSALAFDNTATRYLANTGGGATIPAWSQIDLTNGVTGILPVGNGGTGISNPTDHSLLVGSGAAAMTELGVATDGQLVIGSTGADPVLATLTAGTGVNITNAAGSITINAAGVDQNNIIYVGKHGNDGNDGLTIEKAKLTFGAAITAAFAIAPAVVVCLDDGTYTENLTGQVGVNIYAPNATLSGAHTILNENYWVFRYLDVATGTTGITMNSAGLASSLKIQTMNIAGTGIGFSCLTGALNINVSYAISVADGYVISPASVGRIEIQFNVIDIAGTAKVFAGSTGCKIRALGNTAGNALGGTGTLFYSTGAATPSFTATINYIKFDVLSDITAGTTVVANLGLTDGTLSETGAGVIIQGGASSIDGVPIGNKTPSTAEFTDITMANAGPYQTTMTGGETALLRAYDTGGASYTTFGTLTAGNPPTFDLAAGVTLGGAYIYRAGGTDVAVTDGGTGLSAVATGELLYGSAANTYSALAFDGTATRYLANTGGGATIPAWSQIDLTNGVTGILPVGNGGTGATTLTDHGVLVGSGAGAITPLAVGATGELLIGATGADPAFGTSATGDFTFTSATAAQDRALTVSNTDTTAANYSAAHVEIQTQSATTGDPYIRFNVNGGQDYAFGIDNSDSDKLKIQDDTDPSTGNNLWTMTSAGERTMPLQPAFLAYNSATDNNVTGDGTAYTCEFNTEIFDQGGDYDNTTDTFTAPLTARYNLSALVAFTGVVATNTTAILGIITSNGNYNLYCSSVGLTNTGASNGSMNFAMLVDMDAADTYHVVFTVQGVGKGVDVYGSASPITSISGYLAV